MKFKHLIILFILSNSAICGQTKGKKVYQKSSPRPNAEKLNQPENTVGKPAENTTGTTLKIAKVNNFTLANGLKVYIVSSNKLPTIKAKLLIDQEPNLEGKMAGLKEIVWELLKTGTNNKTTAEFDKEINSIGATITTSNNSIQAISSNTQTNRLINLIADIIINPNFSQTSLDLIKANKKAKLAFSKEDPTALANQITQELLFGNGHPYGEQATNETIDNISLEACQNYVKNNFIANAGYLAIMGDIDPKEAKILVEKYFSSWQHGTINKQLTAMTRAENKTKIVLIDRPNAVESIIKIANVSGLIHGSEDDLKAYITNEILGGEEGRLFNNLSKKLGFTKGAYSTLNPDKVLGKFITSAIVPNNVLDSTIAEMITEINQIRNSEPTQNELNKTKKTIAGSFALSLENPETLANFAINTARYNLPGDYYINYLKNLEAITSADVKNTAQKYIIPDNYLILIVGNAAVVGNKLKQFGEVEYYDTEGKIAKIIPAKPIGKIVDTENILEKYINKIGGKQKIEGLKDLKITMSGTQPNGKELKVFSTKKMPNKSLQVVNIMGDIVQKTIIDGTKISSSIMGKEVNYNGANIGQMINKATLFYELNTQKLGMVTKLVGNENVEGKECTNIQFTMGNNKWNEYYDLATGLKLKTKEIQISNGVQKITEVFYSDYKEVSGILFPHTIRQTIGKTSFDLKITEIKTNTGVDDKLFLFKK